MFFSSLLGTLAFIISVLFLLFSDCYILESKKALINFFSNIFPAIFPFFVISTIFVECLVKYIEKKNSGLKYKFFKLPPLYLIPLFYGLICGYPAGAKIVADLKNNGLLNSYEASIISGITNNIGPFFTIIIVGHKYLHSKLLGLFIWVSISLSSVIIIYIFSKIYKKKICLNCDNNISVSLKCKRFDYINIVVTSLNSSLYIGATIIFFASLMSLLSINNIIPAYMQGIIYSICELTGGLNKLYHFIQYIEFYPYILCILCSWTGLCTHIQVCGILYANKISCRYYIVFKLFHILLSPILLFTMINIFT